MIGPIVCLSAKSAVAGGVTQKSGRNCRASASAAWRHTLDSCFALLCNRLRDA